MINFVKNSPQYRLEVVTQTIIIFISGALVWGPQIIKMLLVRRVHGEEE